MRTEISRRGFLGSAVTAAGAAGAVPPAAAAARPGKVIDCHTHLHTHHQADWREKDRKLIEAADKLGIDQLCCSILTPRRPATADQFRECNRHMAEGIRRFPGRVLAYAYVNPGYRDEALDNIRRSVEEHGFIGVKIYNEYRADEPVLYPIIELAIELRVPILMHAGHMHYEVKDQPRISDGGHIADLARRYPEAMLICGHVCGGGDWEWTIKALRNAPSVYLDTSGSVIDDGVIEMCVEVLGAGRVMFATDLSQTAGVGKLRSAELRPQDRARIMGDNMAAILRKRGAA